MSVEFVPDLVHLAQRVAPRLGDRVVLARGLLRDVRAHAAGHEAAVLKPVEDGVQRALLERERAVRAVAKLADQLIAVFLLVLQQLQDEHVERALLHLLREPELHSEPFSLSPSNTKYI